MSFHFVPTVKLGGRHVWQVIAYCEGKVIFKPWSGLYQTLGFGSGAHSHVHGSPVSSVSSVHGALNDLRGEVTRGPAYLCVLQTSQTFSTNIYKATDHSLL